METFLGVTLACLCQRLAMTEKKLARGKVTERGERGNKMATLGAEVQGAAYGV